MMRNDDNHGDRKTRKILRVRVQRDRRPSVVSVVDGRIGCRRRGVRYAGRIGLGIAPERGDTALNLISAASAAVKSANSMVLTFETPGATVGGDRAIQLKADHEARGIAEIVSEGRPQRCARRNRIVRAIKSGTVLAVARLRASMAVSSAGKPWYRLAECLARISEILNRLGVFARTLSTCVISADYPRSGVTSARLDLPRVRLPRAGVKIGLTISALRMVRGASNTKGDKLVMKFVMFTIEGGPDHGKKIAVNRDRVDCVVEHEGTTIIYFVGQKQNNGEGWFDYVIVREDFATVQSRLNTIAE